MREIEIKLKIPHGPELRKKFEDLGCAFSHPIEQEDIVYTKNTGNLEIFLSNSEFLRIRTESNSKVIFTYKKDNKAGERGLDKLEYEFEVGNKDECRSFLDSIGYKEAVRVFKKRTKTRYKDFEICLDEVEHLGFFVEVEKAIPDEGDPEQAFHDIESFIASLGFDLSSQVKDGYDVQILKG